MTFWSSTILPHALLSVLLAAAIPDGATQTLSPAAQAASLGIAAKQDAASAVQARNPYYDASKSHHTPGGFRNNYRQAPDKSILDFLRWKFSAQATASAAKSTPVATPQVSADERFIQSNAKAGTHMVPAATWLGHASLLVQAGGINVLTDPMFSERASPVQWLGYQRHQPPGLALDALPHIDAVLISHDHYDHLDEASVLALSRQAGGSPLFLVPLGLKPWFVQRGMHHVKELDWLESATLTTAYGKTEFHLTPVQHWSSRILVDRQETLWGGWAVFSPSFHWYFAGDSGYSKDFADTAAHFAGRHGAGGSFDLALLPIGAYQPEWFLEAQHMSPKQAVQVHLDLKAKRSIAMHWGTFDLGGEPLDQPPRDLALARAAAQLPESSFDALAIGQTMKLPRRASTP